MKTLILILLLTAITVGCMETDAKIIQLQNQNEELQQTIDSVEATLIQISLVNDSLFTFAMILKDSVDAEGIRTQQLLTQINNDIINQIMFNSDSILARVRRNYADLLEE